ncbi:glycosyltransferase family 2 protein [Elizabethkingia sp. JS20170427COW]|uniref:glycosyltransferase family 2 protein n=1 Tax=Elizabethkingia sp. JS20170427COW TaxID=2583851 RepID=UPI0011107B1A|nr:glycosyltransferase family 2 protein [Elizabethkingia sp. JS20170427COW]QCX53434.1 glycosyltransferase family 2 protein [Elizabethkingia sp. JS20170427COW]
MNQLAIVIPYYKINFFEETLKSVAQQTDKRFTLYIGNDASPDDPLLLIQKYFPDGNYHYFNYQENLGGKNLAMQWERILENVQEDWFQILGDDDMIAENFVEEFYKNLSEVEKEGINVIKIKQALINESSIIISNYTNLPRISTTTELMIYKFTNGGRSSLTENIFKSEIAKRIKFKKYPLAWHSDDAAILDFSLNNKIFSLNDTFAHIRLSSNNISGSGDKYQSEMEDASYSFFAYFINSFYKFISKDTLNKFIKQQLYRCWKYKKKLNLNLFIIYLYTLNFKDLIKLPTTIFLINKNANQ